MRLAIVFFVSMTTLCSCGSDNGTEKPERHIKGSQEVKTGSVNTGGRELNVNILWDLSDRIDVSTNAASPQHYERDIEVIKTIAEIFRKDMQKKGAYKAKGKFRVFFSPTPQDASINTIAKSLSYNLSAYTGQDANKRKKQVYDSIILQVQTNLHLIYNLVTANSKGKKQWDGSDIWRFFKNDVKEYCVDRDSSYRNILVILTDGYIYHKDSKQTNGNRTSYILPDVIKVFRNSSKWREFFEKGNYGLITERTDLQNLEILVLEINPSPKYRDDEDIIRSYLGKWFREMGVKEGNYNLYNSDLPEYTRTKIEDFFKHQ